MFKTLIQATVAASLVATPMIASAANAQVVSRTQSQTQAGKTTTVRQTANGTVVKTVNHNPNATIVKTTTYASKAAYRKWAKGQRFDRRHAPNYRVVDYRQYRQNRLWAPPRGYHWVRSGNDAVLVGITSGLIAAVIAGAIR